MNPKVLLGFSCLCLVAVFAHATYDPVLENFMADVIRYNLENDVEEDQPCMRFTDMRPGQCRSLTRMDKHFCNDYPGIAKRFCRRSCSPCGPKNPKPPGPSGKCEDKRPDCRPAIRSYYAKHNVNVCKIYKDYVYDYCRRTCAMCTGPLGKASSIRK